MTPSKKAIEATRHIFRRFTNLIYKLQIWSWKGISLIEQVNACSHGLNGRQMEI